MRNNMVYISPESSACAVQLLTDFWFITDRIRKPIRSELLVLLLVAASTFLGLPWPTTGQHQWMSQDFSVKMQMLSFEQMKFFGVFFFLNKFHIAAPQILWKEILYNVFLLSKEICDPAIGGEIIMCPLCDRECEYWRLNTTCQSSEVCIWFSSHLSFLFILKAGLLLTCSCVFCCSIPICLTTWQLFFLPFSWAYGVSTFDKFYVEQ